MATKSISKHIKIKDKTSARNLVFALENAHAKKRCKVAADKKCRDVKGEEIRAIFENK